MINKKQIKDRLRRFPFRTATVILCCKSSLLTAGITDNLIGHWTLNETDPESLEVVNTAPVTEPEHGERASTILVNQPSPVGTGYFFDGLAHDDYVELGTSFVPRLRESNGLTISGWINPAFLRPGSGANSRQTILGANSHLQFSLENEGQFVYVYQRSGAFVTNVFSNAPQVSAGGHVHVALTHENDPDGYGDDVLSLYVNGELYGRLYPFPSIQNFEIDGDLLFLGRYEGNTARDFDGIMSDIGLWAGRALTQEEVAVIGGVGRAGFPLTTGGIDDILALFQAQSGTVVTGDWEWSHTTVFADAADGSELGVGKHYYGEDDNIYVILGGGAGAWQGVMAEGGDPFREPILITLQPEDQSVHLGEAALFEVEVISQHPLEYRWFFRPLFGEEFHALPGANSSTLGFENVELANEGWYYCRIAVADVEFSVQTRQARLSISDKPVPGPGFIGHWRLDETDSENLTVLNSAPEAIEHGLRTATMEINQPSIIGRAYRFFGQEHDDHIVLGSTLAEAIQQTNTLTVSAWVNPEFLRDGTGAGSRQVFMGGDLRFQFGMENQGRLFIHFGGPGDIGYGLGQGASPENRVRAGEWNHVAWTRSGSESSLYINGVEVAHRSNFTEDNFTFRGVSEVLYLGRYHEMTARDYDGLMSDVGLWTGGALTPQRISIIGALGRIGLPLSSESEIDQLLLLYESQTGLVETGDWEWSHTTDFSAPIGYARLELGLHYIGIDERVYVIIGGIEGGWSGLVAEGGELNGPPIVVVEQPEDQDRNRGESTAFEVSVRSSVPVAYQWHFTPISKSFSVPLEGETDSSLMIGDIGMGDQGFYFCVISEVDGDFSVSTREAFLSILDKPMIEPGLIGHWRLNETDSGNLTVFNFAPDALEHGIRTPTTEINQPSIVGQAYGLSGQTNNDHIVLGSTYLEALQRTNTVTVSAWVNPEFLRDGTGAGSRQVFMGGDVRFQFGMENQGRLYIHFGGAGDIGYGLHQGISPENRVRTGEWNHVAWTRSGSEASLYINGVEVAHSSAFLTDDFIFRGDSDVLYLGRYYAMTARDFDGLMSEVGLWTETALNQAEIAVIGGLGRTGWPLSSTDEKEAILTVFDTKGGTAAIGNWKWSYSFEFPELPDGTALAVGRHYTGENGDVHVVLGGSAGSWEGVVAQRKDTGGYNHWVALHFSPEESGDETISGIFAAPGGDGVANLLKYAFGLEPKVPADRGQLPLMGIVEDNLVLYFSRLKDAPDIEYVVEVSTELVSWEEVHAASIEEILVEDQGESERVAVRMIGLPDDIPGVFCRLRVVLNP